MRATSLKTCGARMLAALAALALLTAAAHGTTAQEPQTAPKRILLIGGGPDGHPPGTHEYMAGLRILSRLLERQADVQTVVVLAPEPWPQAAAMIGNFDGVVLFLEQGARWVRRDPARLEALQQLLERGGGLTALHWGIGCRDAEHVADFVNLVGGCHGGPDRKYMVLETEVHMAEPRHPITSGIEPFTVRDEFYYRLKFPREGGVQPLWQVTIEGEPHTVAWAWDRPAGGRTFGFSGLHFHDNWQMPEYRRLVAQGVLWTIGAPVPQDGLPLDLREEEPVPDGLESGSD